MRHIFKRGKRAFTLQLYDRSDEPPPYTGGSRWGVRCAGCNIWIGRQADTGNIDIWVCHSRRTAETVAETEVCHLCGDGNKLDVRRGDERLLKAARDARKPGVSAGPFISFIKKLAAR